MLAFRTDPFVCGVIGPHESDALDRMLAAAPGKLTKLLDRPDLVLWSSGRLARWGNDRLGGYLWASRAAGPQPTSWRSAAESRLACGVVLDTKRVLLHTDALGLGELYTRSHAGALYFASRIDPLIASVRGRLHTDWSAWATTFTLGSPLGDATPFTEIRRVGAATAWEVAAQAGVALRKFTPAFVIESAHGPALSAAEIGRLIADSVPRTGWFRRMHVTLSGGWDSRLLATIAAKKSRRRVRAWTTSPDDGRDRDVALSRTVASALGLDHRVLIPGPDAWFEEVDVVRQRVQFQTWMHTWLMPLARELHAIAGPLLDGLAGDVTLKSLFVDGKVLAGADPADRRRRLWSTLGGGRLAGEALTERARVWLADASWQSFDDSTRHLDNHRAGLTLSILLTRTARAIASSPITMFGPECEVVLPFVAPRVLMQALRVPIDRKVGGDFYRELMTATCGPSVAGLPSTNDQLPSVRRGPRRRASAAAISKLVGEIRSDESLEALLGAAFRSNTVAWNAALQPLGLYAAWRNQYREQLEEEAWPI